MEVGKKTIHSIVAGALLCIFVYWLLHETERFRSVYVFVKNIVSPFVVGAGLAFILNVPMRGIENWFGFIKSKGLRRAIAIVLTFVALLLVIAGVLGILVPQIYQTFLDLAQKLPEFGKWVIGWVQRLFEDYPRVLDWVQENFGPDKISQIAEKIIDYVQTSLPSIWNGTIHVVKGLSTGIFNAVVSLVFGIYCLARKEVLARQARRLLYAFVPEKISDITVRILRLTNATFSNFISGQCIEAVILGSLFAVSMLIFGMPYIPLVSVLIAVTALIPIVGAFVGCIFGAFFILVSNPIQAVWFVIMFLILQQFENNVIYPKVVGKSVGLPGMWVLLAVSVGGELMGVAGMLIMIPAFSVLYTLLREICKARIDLRGVPSEKLQAHPPELGERAHERLFKFKKMKKTPKTAAPEVETQEEQ